MRRIVSCPSTQSPFCPMVRSECESPHHWVVLLVSIFRLMASCFLAEHLYTQTLLKFDEAARELQKLEGSTRKEVCAAVKAFNKDQVSAPMNTLGLGLSESYWVIGSVIRQSGPLTYPPLPNCLLPHELPVLQPLLK